MYQDGPPLNVPPLIPPIMSPTYRKAKLKRERETAVIVAVAHMTVS
jgi:hypothetical protein